MSQTDARSRQASGEAALLGGDIDNALSDIAVPVFVLGGSGVIRWQNATATELVGEIPGRHFSSVVAPEAVHHARVEFAKQMVGTARTTDSRLVIRSADGTRFRVTVHTVSLEDGQRVVGVFGVMEVDRQHVAPAEQSEKLTPRQRQVLVELAGGASTAQIAASLGVAPVTVRNHVRGLLRALGVHSRLEAVAESRRRGLLGP